ncbi:von Willebrand factor type A-like protein [Thioflavicoccus mobilis 8321]|uniref:von Willebrand factor type A-like protein n=1 Tax=Thioflavicoccus mobilis 8321 TaxID=765912 RepID=L0GVQ3_9GAMM|nr:VWA domain-containing protein [Thioflavicoccus mobilis]AGA89917.1 von Willebrand factor type A-like protein [Thioflavicoccus mobilis 8321]
MADGGLHLAQPAWLWLLAALVPVALWRWRSAAKAARGPIHRYADAHLLPYLTGSREPAAGERWGRFLHWAAIWTLLVVALAGPRWDYAERPLFQSGDSLLVLLDISRSMQVDDVAPNRLARARQEVADLIRLNQELRLGLIAFASVPLVISPVSEDTAAIGNALPALSTDLPELPGSRLLPALARAETLLDGIPPEGARSILLISDGDFAEPGLAEKVADLAARGIHLHALGVGTAEGGQVPAPRGGWVLDREGRPVRSRLDAAQLRELAKAGDGLYEEATYRDDDSLAILSAAAASPVHASLSDERARIWNERFYLPVLIAMALLLAHFRPRAPRRRGPERP